MGYMQLSAVLLIVFLCQIAFSSSLCPKDQSISLLNFKKSLTIDPSYDICHYNFSKLSSWNTSSDCCLWDGVTCDEMSVHVIELDVSCSQLVGVIDSNSSLFQLSHLKKLVLSMNDFSSSRISPAFGRFSRLTHLHLSDSHFSGQIPSEIFSLSNLTRIESLYLRGNSLNGTIPSGMFSLPSLIELDLSDNHFSGHLEDFKSNSLRSIDLNNNQLQGRLPKSIQNLVNLTWLDLSSNNFSGDVDVSLFSNIKNLQGLDLSYNRFSLTNENRANFTLPESLFSLRLAACEVKELEFIRPVKKLWDLNLSNNKIQGRIPDWAWPIWLNLDRLNLSHNMLTDMNSTNINSISYPSLYIIDLRSNFLQGSLPILPNSAQYLFMSNNNLSEEIPSSVCNLRSLKVLDLAKNNLMGEIPQCLGNVSSSLEVFDMHQNNLSGTIPTTFGIGSLQLRSLNLHDNKLQGKLPRSLANCKELQVLDLGNNHLNDTFPMWLATLPKLQVLSLRSNRLHGPIGTSRMRNLFPELRILDVAYNALTETLPTSLFQHLKAMRTINRTMKAPVYLGDQYYQDSVTIVSKGMMLELVRILTIYTAIDLSSNKFKGPIPSVMGDFIALHVLNLSHNGLQGQIPPSLGDLSSVESLDLSGNQLSGEIPQQLVSLTSLAFLNLSHNHLQGCIPQGPQVHTFENSSFAGNDGLRGLPISKGCGTNDGEIDTNYTTSSPDEESNSEFLDDFWKAALMGYGSGLCIGLSIIYFIISTGNPKWLAKMILKLEHKLMMRWKKIERWHRNHRRNNRF
ncbi:receptor-like protein 9DC3 [Solanum stenotomum]|uniref:receptor-like protein 9DC3 n=1 Tax=Solanum stenotomum TaxID=172797 RepID=UPI0020D10E0A|nr:receptor-like protein 9DC3 [Solanum stenotomum]